MLLSIASSESLLSLSNTSQLSYVFEAERQLPILPALSCHPVAMLSVCPFSSRQAADHPSENNFFRITPSRLKVFSHCLVQSNKNEE